MKRLFGVILSAVMMLTISGPFSIGVAYASDLQQEAKIISGSEKSAAKISLSKKKVILEKGDNTKLKVKGTNGKVKWSSNKKAVATVNQSGKVFARGVGTATITAKVSAKKYTCKVIVKKSPTDSQGSGDDDSSVSDEFTLSESSILIDSNTTIKAYYGKKEVSSYDVNWSSSDEEVLDIINGTIYVFSNGEATITAGYKGKEAICQVKVVDDASRYDKSKELKVDENSIVMGVKDNYSYNLSLSYGGETIEASKAMWTSSNESVAKVLLGKKIYAYKTGEATITGVFNEKTVTINVLVVDYAEGYSKDKKLSLDCTTISLSVDDYKTISATYGTESISSYNVTWSSSNESIATVTYGKIRALSAGTTTITASYNNSTATCIVTVEDISTLQKVKNAIYTYGFTNQKGTKTVKLELSDYTYMVVYDQYNDTIELGFVGINSYGSALGTIKGNQTMTGSADVYIVYASNYVNEEAETTMNIETYSNASTLDFMITNVKNNKDISSDSDTQEFFNTMLQLIMRGCDLALYSKTGYHLSDAGFINYER